MTELVAPALAPARAPLNAPGPSTRASSQSIRVEMVSFSSGSAGTMRS